MSIAEATALPYFKGDLKELFYRRTLICLWLAVIFFSLFIILDYVSCREYFGLFFMYRMVYVVVVIGFINLLAMPSCKKYAPHLIYAAMMLGGLAISLMTVRLGGFHSGYYVGLLLMIAGALSVLPLRVSQVIFIGMSMYVLYIVTVLLGTGDMGPNHIASMANNSFFFLSLIMITALQSHDDLLTLMRSIRASKNLQSIRKELTNYTGGLESLVLQRLQDLEETDVKYRDLYDSITDLLVLADSRGVIKKINRYCVVMLGYGPKHLEEKPFADFIYGGEKEKSRIGKIISQLSLGKPVEGVQLQLVNGSGQVLETELSASRVEVGNDVFFQFVIRDISATKAMEMQLLDSERLIGTSRQAAILGLAKLAECRDDDTGAHLTRIRLYTEILIRYLATLPRYTRLISENMVEDIPRSSVLHDIGKVGTPDSILLKPGRLTREEFEEMKNHCHYGSDILEGAENGGDGGSFLLLARDIARHHHERWDGSGYPDGLAGDEIPFAARIVALADVYDALTSTRVYKASYNHEEAKSLIVKERGAQFDPAIVDAFLAMEHEFRESRMHALLQEQRAE